MPYSKYLIGNLPWYSVLVVTGMLAAYLLAQRQEKRMHLPDDTAIDLVLLVIPIGVISARLYYVLFSLDVYINDPLSVFNIRQGGLAIYGGLIAGLAVIIIFAKYRGLSAFKLLDMVAPGVALAQAIGRWGNFFNMQAYGALVENPRLQFFPFAVLVWENNMLTWHMATFFYESCWNILSFAFLWMHRKNKAHDGDTVLTYIMLYGLGRQMIEPLRTDSLMLYHFRISQVIAVLAAEGVMVFFAVRLFRIQHRMIVLVAAALLVMMGMATIMPVTTTLFRIVWAVGCCILVGVIHFSAVDKRPKRL